MIRFNPEKELYKIQYGGKNKIIFSVFLLLIIIAMGSSYALYQARYSKRIIYTKVAPFSNKDLNLSVYVDGVPKSEFPQKDINLVFISLICENGLAVSSWDSDTWGLRILTPIILPNKCDAYFVSGESFTKEFLYSGHEEEYEIPKDGLYKIELWGAAGGQGVFSNGTLTRTYLAGNGGYTTGVIELKQNEMLYFYVGGIGGTGLMGSGRQTGQSYNGGGSGKSATDGDDGGGGGGGATDVRLVKGAWNDFNSLKSRIMVAGGGGGANDMAVNPPLINLAGSGGGLTGVGDIWAYDSLNLGDSYNATQKTGYRFGIGEDGLVAKAGGAGAGGGYYGGTTTKQTNDNQGGGGGGSSFISGHKGCDAIDDTNSTNINKIQHTGSPNHYSGKVFTNTIMIDGLGYYWTDSRQTYSGMPTFDGKGIMQGNTCNGHAKITYLGPSE